MMSYIDFSLHMGLVDMEYTHTESYSQLQVDLLVHLTADQVWTQTFRAREMYVCSTSKASTLGCSAFIYLHVILSRILIGRGDSMEVINL